MISLFKTTVYFLFYLFNNFMHYNKLYIGGLSAHNILPI